MTTSFAPVVKQVGPSVANVYTTAKARMRNTSLDSVIPDDPFFRRFFGDRLPSRAGCTSATPSDRVVGARNAAQFRRVKTARDRRVRAGRGRSD